MTLISKPNDHPQSGAPPARVGWRVNEWAKQTGTSRETTYRRINDGSLKTMRYGGVTLILGFVDQAIYTHPIPVEIAILASGVLTPKQALDATLMEIGEAVEADRTLGGLCDFLEPEAPSTGDLEATATVGGRWADAVIVSTYATSNPLT